MLAQAFSHCHFCGTAYPPAQIFPKVCAHCQQVAYRNPTPVAVAIVPVQLPQQPLAVLLIQRAIPPHLGQWALPGGFIDYGESWQAGLVREVSEETGLHCDASQVTLFAVHSPPGGNTVLIFGCCQPFTEHPTLTLSSEISAGQLVTAPVSLAFPLHTQVLAQFFKTYSSK